MRALVAGGAGFIGSHLCRALIRAGHSVVCVDNFSLGTRTAVGQLGLEGRFRLQEADAASRIDLERIFEEEKPEYVFHLAANSDIQASAADPDVEYRNTYTTTYELLACMRKYHVKKLFFASTSAVYGDKRGVALDEDTPGLSPISYYGAAKLGSEALISAFSYMNGIHSLIFRFPNVIGPGLTHGVIFDFMQKLRSDPKHLQILGDGRQTKPYIFVDDLIEAVLQFMMTPPSGVSLYNVGVDGETSVNTIADILCEEMGLADVAYQYTGGDSGWRGDVPRFRYCLDKIHSAGWSAKYTSDEAVRKAVQCILEKGRLQYEKATLHSIPRK